MKRTISMLLITILALCFLVGCANEPSEATATGDKQTQYSIEKLDSGYYSCRIFNKESNQIFEHTLWKEPAVTAITENLLCFIFLEGPTASCNWGIFYDCNADEISKKFNWVLDFTDEIVVIGTPDKLVLCSIFDDSFYKEVTNFSCPLAQVVDGIVSAELTDNGNAVDVTYIIADSYGITTERISLV